MNLNNKRIKNNFTKIILAISLIITTLLVNGCVASEQSNTTLGNNVQATAMPTLTSTPTTIHTKEITVTPTPTPTSTPTPTKTPTVEATPIPTVETKQTNNQTVVVYITNTGKKYHSDGCRYLSKSKIPIDLSKAKNDGYEPCSVCNPPQ